MLEVQPIDSFDDPALAPYRTMRRHQRHRTDRIFVAEGVKVVQRLLESDLGVVSVVLPEAWLAEFRYLLESRPEPRLPVYVAGKKLVEALTGFSMFQGVLAVGRMPSEAPLEDLLALPPPRMLVAVDGLTNSENIGAVVRCCGALGVQALVVGETSSSPYLRRAVRSGMGIVFRLPVLETPALTTTLDALRRGGIRMVAAHPRPDLPPPWRINLTADCCLVLGSEGYGLRPEVLAVCDEAVAIPMPSHVDSLNVSHAAAALLYEAHRQRAGG
ncbi:MAG: RNA methyltransferase [Verrucomicrobiales bacterium]|nr:RNA methyltransferase [Verrucomicrobiales bacterium]